MKIKKFIKNLVVKKVFYIFDKNNIMSKELIKWLEKRISITEKEKNKTDEFNIMVTKGAKLTVYKEVLEYVVKNSKSLEDANT